MSQMKAKAKSVRKELGVKDKNDREDEELEILPIEESLTLIATNTERIATAFESVAVTLMDADLGTILEYMKQALKDTADRS